MKTIILNNRRYFISYKTPTSFIRAEQGFLCLGNEVHPIFDNLQSRIPPPSPSNAQFEQIFKRSTPTVVLY